VWVGVNPIVESTRTLLSAIRKAFAANSLLLAYLMVPSKNQNRFDPPTETTECVDKSSSRGRQQGSADIGWISRLGLVHQRRWISYVYEVSRTGR
jgi:hypothetical protein